MHKRLPKSLTTVTTFSKLLALLLFILFPFFGFYVGMGYQKKLDGADIVPATKIPRVSITPTPTQAWETYSDKRYLVEFEYPKEEKIPFESTTYNGGHNLTVGLANDDFVEIYRSKDTRDVYEILKEHDKDHLGPWTNNYYHSKSLLVDNIQSVETFNEGTALNTDSVFVNRNGYLYIINHYHNSPEIYPRTVELFDHLLASIRFFD